MSDYPDLAEAFRRAPVIFLASAAPRDGTPIAARNAEGDVQMIRWRTGVDIDEVGDEPYWATYRTDEPFEIIEWIPSPISIDEILTIYE